MTLTSFRHHAHVRLAVAAVVLTALAPAYATEWEGAIGPLLANGPAYAGAAERKTRLMPGFYLRYGNLSVTKADLGQVVHDHLCEGRLRRQPVAFSEPAADLSLDVRLGLGEKFLKRHLQ